MAYIQLDQPPRFLTHHLPLRPDCVVQLTLPTDLTQAEANRLSAFLDVLVLGDQDTDDGEGDTWPFEGLDDPDGDLDPADIDAVDDDFPDMDLPQK